MKGFTTDKQLGKRDGRRYYQQKGVEGIVSASINQGMSSRVKNDAAYANTRLNNAEFGAAGSTAGAITRSLSQKWRYLLVPFAAGKLAKDVRALMMDDTTNPWGQRSLQGTDWQKVLADKVSQFSKNPISDYTGLALECVFNGENGLTATIKTDSFQNDILVSKGADGVMCFVLEGVTNCSKFNTEVNSYESATADYVLAGAEELLFDRDYELSFARADMKQSSSVSNKLHSALIVMLPYKEVNGERYILQELCSFQMLAAHLAA